MTRIALVRPVSPRLAECELAHLPRRPIDPAIAARQHAAYCDHLVRLGCQVETLPATPDQPDGVFVEDTAVVLDELAVLARSGATSRRDERPSVEAALGAHRPIARIVAPGTLDGGDVLRLGRHLLVGLSARTNAGGVRQLSVLTAAHGYRVHGIPIDGSLHLKSACTAVADDLVVINRAWVDPAALTAALPSLRFVDVHADEPHGANHLLVGAAVLSPTSCPRTVERLRAHGVDGASVDVSELEKAESGVTCSSIIFDRS